MKHRIFGKTGYRTSEIGLGCWQLGGDWGEVSERTAHAILEAAVDHGVNFLDTADVYGGGRSESIIGTFLKQRSEDLFVATKVGRDADLYPDKYSEDGIRACVEGSLDRLGLEALDLLQLHCIPTQYLEQGEVFEWLRRLQQEGKIKAFGASVESMYEARICMQQDDLASLQIIFNIFRQKPIHTIFDEANDKNVALIVRLPLASGLLAGKFDKTTTFDKSDHRNFNRDGQAFNVGETFAGLPFEMGVELANELKPKVPIGMEMAQWAMRWILDYDAVSVVIPGASRPEQARQNAQVSELKPLSDDMHKQLATFYENRVHDFIRGPY